MTSDKYYPHYARHENGVAHWWLQDDLGNKLDVTIDQFLSEDRQPPYDVGRKGWFLTKNASQRSQLLIKKVLDDRCRIYVDI